jgi:tRNA(fMet)-specific endonuclease VapC
VTLSLDSNVIIDLINGRQPSVRSRFERARLSGETFVTCSIAAYEVLYGAKISARPEREVASFRKLLPWLTVVDWTLQDAETASDINAALEARGLKIGGFDTLIAGQALNRGWTVVTANMSEFVRVDGLTVEDWSRPAP